MLLETDMLLQLDALHYAADYIPKRAIRYFTALGHQDELMPLLVEEAKDVIAYPEEHQDESGCSRLLFHAIMIFGFLREERAIPLVREIGLMSHEAIDEMLGDRLFESVSLALAELFSQRVDELKALVEDRTIDPSIRATCLQTMMFLYGRGEISRDDMVAYCLKLLKQPEEDLSCVYEVIAASSIALHPEELIGELRQFYQEGRIDEEQVKLEEIEESLLLPKENSIEEFRKMLNVHLDDLIAHLEGLDGAWKEGAYERNESCPCGSGQKFKKCCQ